MSEEADAPQDDGDALAPSVLSYSLPPPSTCTALCVLCELIHQRGYDVTSVGDAEVAQVSAPCPSGGIASTEDVVDMDVPRTEVLDGWDSERVRPRAAPVRRPIDDRIPVRFPDRVARARHALRALGNPGISGRVRRLPKDPIIQAIAPEPVDPHCAAGCHNARPGDAVLVFAPVYTMKVPTKSVRTILQSVQATQEELEKSGNTVREVVLVYVKEVIPFAKNELATFSIETGIPHTLFSTSELQANCTTSAAVPMHVPTSATNVGAAMRGLGLCGDAVAHIAEDDPVVKALGLRRGDYVRIRRMGYHGNSIIFYRKVVSTKLKIK